MYTRRDFLRSGGLAAGALALAPAFWRALAAPAQPGQGPYGPLQAPDSNGIRLPAGFRSRVIAVGGQPVPGTAFVRPPNPDGQATYATPDGGWILVTNSETPFPLDQPRAPSGLGAGGASAIRFRADGQIAGAYSILAGSTTNCAGGPTPWGTWLSCEENPDGRVWECDPTGARPAVERLALGVFKHEAAAVDPVGQRVYMTEDVSDGGFYRFTPSAYPDLGAGLLEIAVVDANGGVSWRPVPNPQGGRATPTRHQVPGASRFARGEGMWFDGGQVYIATTQDSTIHVYDTRSGRIDIAYRAAAVQHPPLKDPDNVTVAPAGDIYVCEDDGEEDPLDIAIITPDRVVARFLKVTGTQHTGSELSGVVFDPSGTRMYFSSQRAFATGVTYEITGPFRGRASLQRPPRPLLGLEVPRRIRLSTLRRRGLPVAITSDEPLRADVALRARLPAGSARRARTVTLARRRRRLRRGRSLLRLRVRGRPLRALRRGLRRRPRGVRATVIAELRTGGRVRVLRRGVLILPDRRRRRRRGLGLTG